MKMELMLGLINKLKNDNWLFNDLVEPFKIELQKKYSNFTNVPLPVNVSNYFYETKFTYLGENNQSYPVVLNLHSNNKAIIDFFLKQLKYKGRNLSIEMAELNEVHFSRLVESVNEICRHDSFFFESINQINLLICFFKGENFISTSSPKLLGTIFINKSVFETLPSEIDITIVHEMAHQELFLLNMVDLLIDSNKINNLAHARFQGYERPPIGRFHSLHSIFRMTKYAEKSGHLLFEKLRVDYLNALDDLKVDELSSFGAKIYNQIYVEYRNYLIRK